MLFRDPRGMKKIYLNSKYSVLIILEMQKKILNLSGMAELYSQMENLLKEKVATLQSIWLSPNII